MRADRLPRGCQDDLLQALWALNIKPVVHDQRNSGQPLKATFQGELRPEQSLLLALVGAAAHVAPTMALWVTSPRTLQGDSY